jgi:predicted dehydrogenase
MRFALLGDHPDGLDMARALAESGRHQLAVYCGAPVGSDYLRRWNLSAPSVGDLEEVLADPSVEAILVAGSPANRPAQLRRALQSERPVLCVHPVDQTPDTAYEAAMIQSDLRRASGVAPLLLPLLPEALHPGVQRLAELVGEPDLSVQPTEEDPDNTPLRAGLQRERNGQVASPLGPLKLIELERWAPESLLLEADTPGHKPALPGWDVLRTLGGEIGELFAFEFQEEVDPQAPLLVAGRFQQGGLFQMTLLPGQQEAFWSLRVTGSYGRAELLFPQGWPGPARLTWRDDRGELREASWEAWNPWLALVEVFEEALANGRGQATAVLSAQAARVGTTAIEVGVPRQKVLETTAVPSGLNWQDEIRSLELDDAARRSVARRRASTLEYQEASEEASFKGTMTLVGCGLLWVSLLLLILSRWLPWLGWLIAPVFGLFLLLQLLRWVVPPKQETQGTPKG